MAQKIKSITEAFSMQPATLSIMKSNENYYDKPQACKEIKLEILDGVYDKEPDTYYVGYNFEGEKIFQYLSRSVNVHYENET